MGCGWLAGVVANFVAPSVELHGRARVVQDEFVEAVAGQIALVPLAAFVIGALLVVEHVLGADDAAHASQFHAAALDFFRGGIRIELARFVESGGVGVEAEGFQCDDHAATAFVERVGSRVGEKPLPGKVALLF